MIATLLGEEYALVFIPTVRDRCAWLVIPSMVVERYPSGVVNIRPVSPLADRHFAYWINCN